MLGYRLTMVSPGGVYKFAFDNVYNRLYGAALGIYFNDSLVTSVHNSPSSEPETFSLFQNYPNPFNGSSIITYRLSEKALVNLTLYDVLGREITTLVNQEQQMGDYQIYFTPQNLSSGVYLVRMTAGTFTHTNKIAYSK